MMKLYPKYVGAKSWHLQETEAFFSSRRHVIEAVYNRLNPHRENDGVSVFSSLSISDDLIM